MLSKIIVGSWSILIEAALWFFLLVGLVGGWITSGFLGALGGLIGTFLFCAVFFGAFIVLDDIRKTVKAIESRQND